MSDILRRAHLVNREIFDPTNLAHIESFKIFLATGNWGQIQFVAELPHTEVPATVMSKYARHALQVQVETPEARDIRLASRNIVPFPKPETREESAARLQRANDLMATSLNSGLVALGRHATAHIL